MVKKIFVSLFIWCYISVLTVILFFVMLSVCGLTYFSDKKRKSAHAQCFWWSDAVLRMNPFWTTDIHGLEHIDKNRTYVIVANHQSIADIIILYQTHMQYKWIAKESLFRLPVLGWCMHLAKHINLARDSSTSILHVYRQAGAWLNDGMSVMFFPEGTRSKAGELKPFQSGAFKLAIKKGVAILPIAIHGTADAIPTGKLILPPVAKISMTVLPAIETEGLKSSDCPQLTETARTLIAQALLYQSSKQIY
jgi:1-acyl-sn-glycerol-3-phosphate acyltransferase